jgi:hypothetical protein
MNIVDELDRLADEAEARVANFPGPTCPYIDAALKSLGPVSREAERLYRLNADNLKEDDGVESFVSEVLSLVDDELPSNLEALRSDNDSLRTSLTEALDRLKNIGGQLRALAAKVPQD